MENIKCQNFLDMFEVDENCYSLKRCYDKFHRLTHIKVLDIRGKLYKCLFYDDKERLSNVCLYNVSTGKEVKNATYRSDGKTISSLREYDSATNRLLSVTFFKEDGVTVSSTVEYSENGQEVQFSLYCDNGEIITQNI